MSSIEDLKKEYIGKTFNWLTILDVVRGKWHPECICICKCGNETRTVLHRVVKGITRSCGCYRSSKELADKQRNYWKNNPDKLAKRADSYSRWCKNNPDKVKEKTEKRLYYFKNHPDEFSKLVEKRNTTLKEHPEILKNQTDNYSSWCKNNPDKVKEKTLKTRAKNLADRSFILQYRDMIYCEDINLLLNDELKPPYNIRTKCPKCNNFCEHHLRDVFLVRSGKLKSGNWMLCNECIRCNSVSKPEQEIADYVSTFYSGEVFKNSRRILHRKELDLYYPEKKIAIEYNGDYWHSDLFKDKDYHYNKFKECLEKGIILVSIFESEWNSKQDLIRSYLKDLFSGVENNLSFVNEKIMNNNYPSVDKYQYISNYLPHSYIFGESVVYTCGYSVLE